MPLKFVFLMDPIRRINIRTDSTFVLMLEAQARGHEVLFSEPHRLELRGAVPWVEAQHVALRRVEGDHSVLGPPALVCLDQVDAVFMRKDPPVDMAYVMTTYLLERVDRSRVVLINDPQGIRDFNEKLAPLHFAQFMPRTLVSARPAALRSFIEELGRAVVKPLHMSGGAGVVLLARGDRNIGSILDLLTWEGKVAIQAQEYVERIVEGDKRIVLLDGDPVGAVNRRPRADDLRANLHVGGNAEPAVITEREREICQAIGPELSRRGLVFVGIDVIDGMLTEINVTSPTGLQEISRFDGVNLAERYIDWVERRSAELALALRARTAGAGTWV